MYNVILGGSVKRLGLGERLVYDNSSQTKKMIFDFSNEDFEPYRTCFLCIEKIDELKFCLREDGYENAEILEIYPRTMASALDNLELNFQVIGKIEPNLYVYLMSRENYKTFNSSLRETIEEDPEHKN